MGEIKPIDAVLTYLLPARDGLREYVKPLREYRDALLEKHDAVFGDDIREQYLEAAKSMIADHVSKAVNVDIENTLIVLEQVNLGEFLGE